VTDPSGRTWTVERHVLRLPHRRRYREPDLDASDALVGMSEGLEGLAIGVVLLVVIVLTIAFVWPLVVLLAELVAAIAAMVVRFVLGRWTVAAGSQGERKTWPVRGMARSAAFAADVAAALCDGASLADLDPTRAPRPLSTPRFGLRATGSSGHVRVHKR
jgi:hypothetical protein